ncbi:Transposon Tf2-9 polyprotein [Labeo rohita]|uniref:Transposon Tf2-9 polyprotein n=1 Tax=Labeo rohita TaxID=84645 RepID=A0ABQ8LUM0_LABRO|nr:Transposon Tf2-9 polyprotein [Labeo rohita]
MDPKDPESPLQKSSPNSDPAAMAQLSFELSAQATQLAAHHLQLTRLTTLTKELVKTLQSLQIPPAAPAPMAATAPAPPAISSAARASATISPRLAFPEKFDGDPAKCKGFLLQCSLFVNQQPALYPTDSSRIAFVCALLTGRALDWATALWRVDGPSFPTFDAFLQHFCEVFEHPAGGKSAGDQLLSLSQGKRTAADYALTFRTLATQTTWVEDTLKVQFCRGLCHELQSELACRDEGRSLNEYINLAIQVDNLIRSRRPSHTSTRLPLETTPTTEAMQVGTVHLTLEERERRMLNHLCLYCGQAGHVKSTCPVRPTNPSCALALDGRPLGEGKVQSITEEVRMQIGALHTEIIQFYTIPSPHHPIILGLPWLHQHDPHISWRDGEIQRWSLTCQEHCLPTIQPLHTSVPPSSELNLATADLPSEYEDLKMAFSKEKASQLPPHRSVDCAIELLPGQSPPKGRIFPLSQPESEAMNNYIKEKLAKGFIRPSTSPASAGFFFVKKKDGGLWPCIDYRGLNEVTVKFRYPLPLVPAALEKLCQARYYTKLDLRNAYNLIRIREGDEWKTAFSTTSGHYEYLVMPFGLANCPSIFQSFMNDIFRDMLDKWVIVYIDDILIFSNTLSEHVQHVRSVLKRLIQYQLYAKLEKCEFHRTSTSFLGYVISQEGVVMEEKKELQRFLGFANFYRRFIRNFSSVAAPLTAMTKRQTTRLTWSPEAFRAFDELRERFTSAPILRHPDPNKPFIVEVDASNTGVGAILSQRHGDPAKIYPCAYFSRKLSPAERNYDVGNRELLAMKLALEEWRHWLEGAQHPFTILTDHKNLEYLRSAKRLNPRQARWALFFTRFQFFVTYRPGSKNTKADALSRQAETSPHSDPQETITIFMIID